MLVPPRANPVPSLLSSTTPDSMVLCDLGPSLESWLPFLFPERSVSHTKHAILSPFFCLVGEACGSGGPLSEDMNLPVQGLQRTWPHGLVRTAFTVLLRFLSHAGHMRLGASDEVALGLVLKCIVTSNLSDKECLFSGVEAGHSGEILTGLASFE